MTNQKAEVVETIVLPVRIGKRRAQSSSYCDRLNAVQVDVQHNDEHLGGFHIEVSENAQSLHIADTDSTEERGGRRTTSGGDGDDIEFFHPPAGRRSHFIYSVRAASK